ncbi:unnamed protein product [Amoebophrya sp. A120]|nr:unnamed protein product [Amoebophrya sp. A120]|eukprot:GSA120T00003666001.1
MGGVCCCFVPDDAPDEMTNLYTDKRGAGFGKMMKEEYETVETGYTKEEYDMGLDEQSETVWQVGATYA